MSDVKGQMSNVARGFTLVELLVSISIFALITTAVVTNFRSGQRSDELRLGAKAVADTLQALATYTQSGTATSLCPIGAADSGAYGVCSASCAQACQMRVPSGGYGIHIGADGTITEFADMNNRIPNHALDTGEALPRGLLELSQDIMVASDVTDVVFTPPDGAVWLQGGQTLSEAHITVTHKKVSGQKVVTVQRASGRINVQ